MFKQHLLFKLPDDETKIWRYLDFEKFLSLISTETLYFCRSDKFEDTFEGTLSLDTINQIKQFCEQFDNKDELFSEFLLLFNATRKMTLVNCWHINDNESDGMWKLYGSTKNSIAIQSTVGKLKKSFNKTPEDIFIGEVNYLDFNKDFVQAFNAMSPFIYKRKSFEHEKELRAVYWNSNGLEEIKDKEVNIEFVEHGLSLKVDYNELIDNIFISPTSDPWFFKLVNDILTKYNITKNLQRSELLTIPEYLQGTQNNSKESLNIPTDILNHFISIDSHRIVQIEKEKERIIKLQTESVYKKMEHIDSQMGEVCYNVSGKNIYGEKAVSKFGNEFLLSKKLKKLISSDTFKTIYFIIGRFDNLIIELLGSDISDREKRLMLKDILFLLSEKFMEGIINVSIRLEREKMDQDVFLAIIKTVHKFKRIMDANKI